MTGTYTHKLTNQTLTPQSNGSIVNPQDKSEVLGGVWFNVKETGEAKFMTNHQVKRLLK